MICEREARVCDEGVHSCEDEKRQRRGWTGSEDKQERSPYTTKRWEALNVN
jgi:hypothetical protein